MLLRLALVCLAFTAPAATADCVSFDSFSKGVHVKLEDGSTWIARRSAHEVIRIDQTNHDGAYAQYAIGPYGVFVTEGTRNGIGTISENEYVRRVPEPSVGMDWTSVVKSTGTSLATHSTYPVKRGKVHVTAGDLRVVQLNGCKYRVMGVDIAYSADLGGMVQHFAYFPDLRFGLQTKVTYKDGSTDSAGITGMRVAK